MRQRVGLDVLVEHLGGVELGCVAGQEVQLDELGVGGDPSRAVGGVAVHDEHELRPLLSFTRRRRKSRKIGPAKRSLKTRKRRVPVFETAAIMLALKRLPVPLVRGLADRRPRPSGGVIRAQARLVGAQDRSALLARAALDLGVTLLKPTPDGLVGLLVGAAHRLLRAEPQARR